jgi:tetratricopeptide (TPR) repeat protein
MNEQPKSIWKKHRKWPRVLFAVACLVTLVALFYAEEDLRGKWAWEKFKHEWEAKGEHFDLVSLAPAPVPDDQNFAMAPVVATTYSQMLDRNGHQIRPRDTSIVNRLEMPIDAMVPGGLQAPATGSWQAAVRTDLAAWQAYYRKAPAFTNAFAIPAQSQSPAADVLLALSKYDPVIEELRQAARLRYSRFPLEYDADDPAAVLLPHLARFKGCAKVLQLRAIAELQLGQTEKALDDVNLSLRLVEAVRTEPILISHLVRIAVVNITLQPVWEGLADHRWSDEQLRALDQELSKLDFLLDYGLSMRGEVTFSSGVVDYLRRTGNLGAISDGSDNSPDAGRISRLIPSGWFYQNQLRCERFMFQWYVPLADQEQRIISPTSVRRADAALASEISHRNPFNVIEGMFIPALSGAIRKFALGQVNVDLARVACALERYRIAHGSYPESLALLAPQWMETIPHDVINGQPLHYERTPDGRFLLYSVGWNETDDGGKVALGKNGLDIQQGDWVWQVPK